MERQMQTFDVILELSPEEVASKLGLYLGDAPQGLYDLLVDEKGNNVACYAGDVVIVGDEEMDERLLAKILEIAKPHSVG